MYSSPNPFFEGSLFAQELEKPARPGTHAAVDRSCVKSARIADNRSALVAHDVVFISNSLPLFALLAVCSFTPRRAGLQIHVLLLRRHLCCTPVCTV